MHNIMYKRNLMKIFVPPPPPLASIQKNQFVNACISFVDTLGNTMEYKIHADKLVDITCT